MEPPEKVRVIVCPLQALSQAAGSVLMHILPVNSTLGEEEIHIEDLDSKTSV